jgi:DnaJ-class molecular chaperone
MDYYAILGIDPKCSETDIKHAYRSLSFKYHPDRNKSEEASVKMRELNEAYETLSDAQKRNQYDCSRNGHPFGMMNNFTQFNGTNLDDLINGLFNNHHRPQEHMFHRNVVFQRGDVPIEVMFRSDSFFGDGRPFNAPAPRPPPTALEKKIDISFEDAYKGINIPIVIEREIRNNDVPYNEEEKLYVPLPQGIDDGEIVEILEKGNVVDNIKGSIKLHIHITPHSLFERKGLNLIYKQTISFKESVCGFDIIIHNLDGNILKIINRNGVVIQNGDERVLKGRGFNRDNNSGDLIILFKVIQPNVLTDEQILLFNNIL